MNVQDREQFDDALTWIERAKIVVADVESNGLRHRRNHYPISFSVYLPEFDKSFNFPFRHGEGEVEVHWSASNPAGTEFDQANWSGRAKKGMYLGYWFNKWAISANFKNLPISWMNHLKAVWGLPGVTYIFHNARFDLHMLDADGFPPPNKIEDTMIALHLVNEDWGGMNITAPFTWTLRDKGKGLCQPGQVGQWATLDGKLMTKRQKGNRRLKWQAALHGFDEATEGETALHAAVMKFEETLTEFALLHPEDPYNKGLIQKKSNKIRSKIKLDKKANMWMLPSSEVAYYAELDVVLTWKLREWCMPILADWNNLELYENQNAVLYEVAWRMECNGIKLNRAHAEEELAKLHPMIEDLHWAINKKVFKIGAHVKLKEFLNSSVLEHEWMGEWPEWWPGNKKVDLKIYPGAYLSSTNKESLKDYDDHPLVRMIVEYRKLKMSADTYLTNWLEAADENNIVRPGMNPDGTNSGRFSSSGDAGNFQNIPDRGGYTIKRALVPYDPSWILFALDYGQLEARLAAWVAETLLGFGNLEMTMLFENGVDMHVYTRDIVNIREVVYPGMTTKQILTKLGEPLDDKPEALLAARCRGMGKTMNFGLLYNGTEYMLSALLKIDKETARKLVYTWRELFPAFAKAQAYFEDLSLTSRGMPNAPEKNAKYITQPISGRHRKIHRYPTWVTFYENGIRKGFNPQEAASRKTWNNVPQGLGGYLCTVSGLKANRLYDNDELRFFANIHDALDGFVNRDNMPIIKNVMSIMIDWDIRPGLTVDLSGSKDGTWQGMSEVKDFDLWCDSKGKEGYD